MSDRAKLENALIKAHQAGDFEAANVIAEEIKKLGPGVSAQAANMAAADVGVGESVAIAAGRGFDKLAMGLKQAVMKATGNKAELEKMAIDEAEKDAAYKPVEEKHPLATAGGEALPYVAVPASAGILPAAAIVGGTEAVKYGDAGERASRGFLGATTTAAGGFLAKTLGKFISPVSKKAAGETHQAALEAAERVGVKPRLSEVTGSNWLKRLEDTVAQLPGGGGVMAEHAAGNAAALNQAALRSIGEAGEEVTPAVLAQASKRIGQVFEDIKGYGKGIQIGPDVAAAADEVLRTQKKMLPHQQDQNLIAIANQAKALAANKGRIDGETYQLVRSGLSDASFSAEVGTNKQLYGKLLEAIDNSAEASLRAAGEDALADGLRTARPQWANLKILEKGLTVEGGNVSAARVASTMRTNSPAAFREGRFIGSPMGDVATVGENLRPLREGSQTFSRNEANPLSAAVNALWSYPTARFLTSPAATAYPRLVGGTNLGRPMAEGTRQILEPSGRAAVAAALQQAGLLPVATE